MSSRQWAATRRFVRLSTAIACLSLFLSPATALAGMLVGVGQDPAPPMGPFTGDNENGDMIMVGDASQPIQITIDESPNAPPWMKQFIIERQGEGWHPGQSITVMETIMILPGTPSTPMRPVQDWHEDIDPSVGDGGMFGWGGGIIEVLAPPLGAFPGMVSPDGKSIWFDFPPLPVPAVIKITKQLVWNGGVITGSDPNNTYLVKVNERPSVPEPGTLVLAGIGLAGLAVVARRRRLAA